MRKAIRVALGAAVCCGLAAGCGGQRETGASDAAERFLDALEQGDAAAICASLAPETLEGLVASEGEPCERAAPSLDLPTGSVAEVEVWGDRAQVRTDTDVLFLSEQADGWKIDAAGCRPQGDRPYQCEVSS